MSARMIEMASDPQSGEGETGVLGMRGLGSTPTVLLSAKPAVDALSGLDNSEKLLEDLRRRFDAANPLPWRHGGLNE
jgi:hypothetical protein